MTAGINKIAPLGGRHRSAQSLLAEAMNDPGIVKCALFTIDAEGDAFVSNFEMTSAELCYAAEAIRRFAFGEG